MKSNQAFSGNGLCGEITVTVQGEHDPRPGACHCLMCQRWTGGVFMSFAATPDAVTVEGPVTKFQSTPFAERAFCGTCGTHLWMRNTEEAEAEYDLMPGLFEAAHDWPLRSEIYTDRAMRAIRFVGDHSRKSEAEYEASNSHV